MALEKFTFASLATLDGRRLAVAVEQALRRCESDCRDRPQLEKPRKVTIELQLVPVDDAGDLDSIDFTYKLKEAMPPRESRTYNMKATRGGLLFNEASPDDVDQMTIDMAGKPKEVLPKESVDAG